MSKKNDLVHKPNQTIMISNGDITPTQRKAYNVILQKAWQELRINKNQVIFYFDIAQLKKSAGVDTKDDIRFKNDIRKLRAVEIETVKENGDWSVFGLISQAEKKGNILEVELPQKVRQALIENDYYTTLDLLIIKTLKGKYAIILYEIAVRYKKAQIPELTVEELRKLTGTDGRKSYKNFNDFEKRVLIPAIEEINEKTDIKVSFKTQKRGNKVVSVKFDLVLKNQENNSTILKLNDPNHQIDMFMCEEFRLKVKHRLSIDVSLTELNTLIEKYGADRLNYVLDNLYKFISLSAPKDKIHNYFRSAVINNWDLSNKDVISRIHNFDERTYSDEDYAKFYSNVK